MSKFINIIIIILVYGFSFIMVARTWYDASESTKTGLFFFIFALAFIQNIYYACKIKKLRNNKKNEHS